MKIVNNVILKNKAKKMIVKLTTEQSVYIEIDGYTYYIDHSLDEPIVERWKKKTETETLTFFKIEEDDTDSED